MEQNNFKNTTVMVTDLLKKRDNLSVGLIEYFKKNFAIKIDEIQEKYGKH
jgi:hypothetical protein